MPGRVLLALHDKILQYAVKHHRIEKSNFLRLLAYYSRSTFASWQLLDGFRTNIIRVRSFKRLRSIHVIKAIAGGKAAINLNLRTPEHWQIVMDSGLSWYSKNENIFV